MSIETIYYDWRPDSMLEVSLPEPDNFLKVRETLTRIGIASRKDKKIFQSCHILHKQGRYFIVHFKELFALDGKESNITVNDIERRNAIALLLQDWELLKLISSITMDTVAILSQIKVVSYKEKSEWELVPKYSIGNKKKL
ncbi:translation repressor protein [uncultured Caudovirales phage]|uniref:Translation repressor protein n=1 Tax=uncultured Caudovirales phage TaxID=2100421 RepID=A0A6J5PFY5_9CAUD|nr:translation repressor protein [uncultured Caudovirales phage]CAB4170809.1 translation repressor protein [uncultured Caudovirales phage]CAB4177094.1 translation repressor protein [uncultured Caudovirales phage]CAB4223091.1 translation repressor protein [uncultured Caudovirales phage]